jgi:hypothetical protein
MFYAGRRFGNRSQTLAHCDRVRAQLEGDGWTVSE